MKQPVTYVRRLLVDYFPLDMPPQLRGGQGAHGLRQPERFYSAAMDGERPGILTKYDLSRGDSY